MPSQGPNSPGTSSEETAPDGTGSWANIGNVLASNGNEATSSTGGFSHFLRVSNFGFSIPAGATINGIEVEVEKISRWEPYHPRDYICRLWNASASVGDNKALDATDWPTTKQYISYGGVSDNWGAGLSAADINSSSFGFVMSVSHNFGQASVDHIRITVHYTEASGDPVVGPFPTFFRPV